MSSRNEQFLELLAEHESRLFSCLFALVRNMDDAEDLYQQTLLTAWEKFDQFEPGTNFHAWASKIARYKALSFLQSRRDERLCFSEQIVSTLAERQADEDIDASHARTRALSGCMQKLSDKDRQLVDLSYGSDLPAAAVAEQVGRPAAGVYNSLSRIRGKLFRCIEQALRQEEGR